jgi:hypothetical protein
MTKYQNSFFGMVNTLSGVCEEFQSVWSGNATFSAAMAALDDIAFTQLPALLAQQQSGTRGITATKQTERTTMATALGHMASRIALYALSVENTVLKEEAHLPQSRIRLATDDALVGMVTRITRLATEHLPALAPFGITAADVSALSAKGNAYAALIGAPARQRSSVAEATAALAALANAARTQLRLMDAHMVLWQGSAPAFYETYFIARRITQPGFRTRALEAEVKDKEGAPVQGATLTLPDKRLMRRTSAQGICRIAHLPEGTYQAQLAAPGFAPQELTLRIPGNEGLKLKLVLELLSTEMK